MPNAATGLLSDLFVWTYEMNDSDDQLLVNQSRSPSLGTCPKGLSIQG